MKPPAPFSRRVGLLIALALVGMLCGYLGATLTGNDAWYVCVPVAIALGWLFVADPAQCVASRAPDAPSSGANDPR